MAQGRRYTPIGGQEGAFGRGPARAREYQRHTGSLHARLTDVDVAAASVFCQGTNGLRSHPLGS